MLTQQRSKNASPLPEWVNDDPPSVLSVPQEIENNTRSTLPKIIPWQAILVVEMVLLLALLFSTRKHSIFLSLFLLTQMILSAAIWGLLHDDISLRSDGRGIMIAQVILSIVVFGYLVALQASPSRAHYDDGDLPSSRGWVSNGMNHVGRWIVDIVLLSIISQTGAVLPLLFDLPRYYSMGIGMVLFLIPPVIAGIGVTSWVFSSSPPFIFGEMSVPMGLGVVWIFHLLVLLSLSKRLPSRLTPFSPVLNACRVLVSFLLLRHMILRSTLFLNGLYGLVGLYCVGTMLTASFAPLFPVLQEEEPKGE